MHQRKPANKPAGSANVSRGELRTIQQDGETCGNFATWCQEEYGTVITHSFPAGRTGARLLRMERGGGEFATPATSDLVVCFPKTIGVRVRRDFGAGRFEGTVIPGSFGVMSPGVCNKAVDDAANVVLTLSVPYQNLLDVFAGDDALPSDGDFGAAHTRLNLDRSIVHRVDALFAELRRDNPRGSLYAQSMLLYLGARLLDIRAGRAVHPGGGGGGLAPRQLRRVTDYMRQHAHQDLGLGDLAALVDLSAKHFARAFRQSTGLPPHRWLMNQRIEKARELLAVADLGIAEIALVCGFADQSHFTATFRKMTGMTPGGWRRQISQ
jgi:AraC family transcriptional regulator